MHTVLEKGFVDLVDSMATDLSVVRSARVSFGVKRDKMEDGDEKLIGFLMRDRHGSPFEHNAFTFHVKAPIFIFREWQRHRIGSFNEMSARYKEMGDEWYIPQVKDVRSRIGKPGSYSYIQAPSDVALNLTYWLEKACKESYTLYKNIIICGAAPEQARMFLHVNHFSEMYWTVNARSLMNFLNLRNDDKAQWEIRQYAIAVEEWFEYKMPITHAAFIENGRIAP